MKRENEEEIDMKIFRDLLNRLINDNKITFSFYNNSLLDLDLLQICYNKTNDTIELEFRDDAISAIVDKAIERNTGARGLRSIIEEIMRDIMFDIPSNPKIEKCIITKETVLGDGKPELIINENRKETKHVKKKKVVQNKDNSKETA